MNRTFTRKKHQSKKRKTIKQMNCSPVVGSLTVKNSCYTPAILEQIRLAYNKANADAPITVKNSTEVWKELHDRLVNCETEDCWLNQIKDEKMRKRIDRYIFAPDKPYEWNENPNEWLSNYDILNVLEQYEEKYKTFEFMGPTPIDFNTRVSGNKCVWNELCTFSLQHQMKLGKKYIGIIFNTDPHHKSGQHWISMFIDIPNKLIYFFDSAGSKAPPEVDNLAHKIIEQGKQSNMKFKYLQNAPNRHQQGNTECGMYSLYFIITMLTGRRERRPISLSSRIRLFSKGKIPDNFVQQYRGVYFNGGK
jgi:hypothetical protein